MAGSIALTELYRTMPSWEAMDGQRDGNRYRALDLRKSDKNSQICPTLGWTSSVNTMTALALRRRRRRCGLGDDARC